MSRPVKSDLDFRGTSRARNLPAPSAPGDAVNLSYLNNALDGVTAGQFIQRISSDLPVHGTCVMFGQIVVEEGVAVVIDETSRLVTYP